MGVAYLWLAIYIAVPIAMLILLIHQIRLQDSKPQEKFTLNTWMRLILVIQGIIISTTGITLFLSPAFAATFWPWALTPLTSRAIGAWLIGSGVIALHMRWENNNQNNKIAYISYVVLGAFQIISLLRYIGEVNWSIAGSWIYLLLVISLIPTGLYGWKKTKQTRTIEPDI